MIVISDLQLQYGDRILFNSVSTTIGPKDRIGLVGRNGAGKSTLLKLIAGEQSPDSGSIVIPPKATLGYLKQDMLLNTERSVMQEAQSAFSQLKSLEKRLDQINEEISTRTDYESEAYTKLLEELSEKTEKHQLLGGHNAESEASRVLMGLGFRQMDLERPCNEFSGGWKMRIELAKILLQKPDYVLLDEPTNHLDIESIMWLEDFLKTSESALILISHDKTFLDKLTNRTLEVELGQIHDYKANYSKFKILQKERREKLLATYENQQKEIEHKQKLIEKFRAKANKAKMAQSLIKQLDKMDVVEVDKGNTSSMKMRFQPVPRSGEFVVKIKDLHKSYGDQRVLQGVDFKLGRGEKVAFVGQNGQGKSTLVKIINDLTGYQSGECTLGYNVEMAYYAQDQAEVLDRKLTVLESLEEVSPPAMRPKLRSILGSFLFSGEDVDKKVSVLSGGERARVALARLMLKPINLLILDEPTNHLDMISKDVLKDALNSYDGSMIVVSHDRDFLTDLTERTIEFRDHKLIEHLGDVQEFLRKRNTQSMREIELGGKKATSPKTTAPKARPAKKMLSKEEQKAFNKRKRELEKNVQRAERKINTIEEKIETIELEMADPDFYSQEGSDATIEKYKSLKSQLEDAMDNWEMEQMELDEFIEQY